MAERVEVELNQDEGEPNGEASGSGADSAAAASNVVRWWAELAAALQAAVQHAREQGVEAEFTRDERRYRVQNTRVRLTLEVIFDPDVRNVRFDYSSQAEPPREVLPGATRQPRGLAPEGGILSLRPRGDAIAVFYSDRQLDMEQVAGTLLDPVLFPQESEEAA